MAKDNRNNKRYTREEKSKLIEMMLPPENCSATELSNETGISKSTLSTWKSKAVSEGTNNNIAGKSSGVISSREKFLIVMESYTMSEIELSKYCREKGIYVEEVKMWRTSCISANAAESVHTQGLRQELQDEKKKTKALEKDLNRKEKALAETAALLVLRKKLGAILGDHEED